MEQQFVVYLSLGTNLGNKLQNLQDCVFAIHQQIGTVIDVAPVYETTSWGFEAPNFYNTVVKIHTDFKPKRLLKKSQSIEKELGRISKTTTDYESRVMDIDIISYGNEIIVEENLYIPHKQMTKRNFVLLPLHDIAPNWVHSENGISINTLILQSKDTIAPKKIGNLKQPLEKFKKTNINYIAIEGNIGAGKTTLTTKLAEDINAKIILERFADNPFLPKFYKDQNRYAFPLEMSFLADRYQQISDDLGQLDLFKDFVIADYHIFKSLIFAKVTLQEDEFKLYKTMFDIIYKDIPKPDIYIYLYQNTNRLLQNIKKRGRSYEQEIPEEYLENINQGYLDYIKTQTQLNTIIIDISELDFVKKQEDYAFILEEIMKKLGVG
jgi:deoxyguanosine kinase